MRFKEGPGAEAQPGEAEKVYHATMKIGDALLNLSDDLRKERGDFGGFALLAHLDSDDEAERVFAALLSGGHQIMPVQQTFWASRYGIVTDRFGITWKVQSGGSKRP